MSKSLLAREPEFLTLAPDPKMPNSQLPVLVYRGTATGDELAGLFREVFSANGWGGLWTGAIFGYDHFHSNAHEVVGVVSGEAILGLGGASGKRVEVGEGDVVILPAGTGHRRVRGSSDFMVIGVFFIVQEVNEIYTDLQSCADYRARIEAIAIPTDPAYGANGALAAAWRR